MPDGLIISVDAMGGDDAPDIVINGLEHFLKNEGQGHNLRFALHGDKAQLEPLLQKAPLTKAASTIAHTDMAIAMDAKPSHALRRGKGSSMWNTVAAVKSKEASVGISAGNTGALMAMSKLQLRTMPGVQRPALAARWPHSNGECVILDVGANVESDAAQLTEFAVMGEAYFRALHNTPKPKVGLLNVGVEQQKGNAVVKAAHERLDESELGLNYKGYVEGTDISLGSVDVIVTDGFTGNIAIKTAEGTAKLVRRFLEESYRANAFSKFVALMSKPVLNRISKRINPSRVNGAVFLGLNGIIVKSHGGTDMVGFASALTIAMHLAESDFLEEIERTLTALHDEDDNIGFIP